MCLYNGPLCVTQDYTVSTLGTYAVSLIQTMHTANGAVREELAARWGRSVGSVTEDLQPLMDLLTSEMDQAADQLTSLRRQVHRLARRHPLLQDQLTSLQ
eukprot:TRINITY_DN115511_c0_g1_i5.p1 TRINITY_DN115511_c0_g1~~TRINITY_DN115511_c0_g1_i5.p1  ORF type:complete len:100 (+),score=23.16 TRINITY_DN115511_c0_g1_i5:43-342(+)